MKKSRVINGPAFSLIQDGVEPVPIGPILSISGRNIDQIWTGGKSIVQLREASADKRSFAANRRLTHLEAIGPTKQESENEIRQQLRKEAPLTRVGIVERSFPSPGPKPLVKRDGTSIPNDPYLGQ